MLINDIIEQRSDIVDYYMFKIIFVRCYEEIIDQCVVMIYGLLEV